MADPALAVEMVGGELRVVGRWEFDCASVEVNGCDVSDSVERVRIETVHCPVRRGCDADWQLGQGRAYLDEDAQARLDDARIEVISTIGSLAVEEDCSFVVVCGDVFETNQVDRRVLQRALSAMKDAGDVVFYLLPGNHEPLNASSIYHSPDFQRRPSNVRLLNSMEPVEVEQGIDLIGAPWPTKDPSSDLVADACSRLHDEAPTGRVRIVVGHGAVDTLAMGRVEPKTILTAPLESLIDQRRIHYVALGDRHSTTDVGATGRIWYSGAPEPTDFREDDPGNVLVVNIDDDLVDVVPKPVGKWRFVEEARNLSSGDDVDLLMEWLDDLPDKRRTIVRLGLEGQVSVAQKAQLDKMLMDYGDELACLEAKHDSARFAVIPDDADETDIGLSGYALEAWNELKSESESSDDKVALIATEALVMMHGLQVRSHEAS